MRDRGHSGFFIFFAAVITVFLWDLIVMKGLFIKGDNFVQFYPWFRVYADSIRAWRLPFWTPLIQAGFPLMAEGQTGGYYPLNALFFLCLPFRFAYNYSVVFHFLLGGVSAYFLTRKLGACRAGGALSAVVFCFGSAYAGCFYNIITLRTLAWTPLVFLLFEYYFERKRSFYVFIAGLIFGFQFLAGFVQLAFYGGIFYLLYFAYRAWLLRERPLRHLYRFLAFCAVAGIVFLPQFILTYKLAAHSSRPGLNLGFALWGSFNPLGAVGTVFPYWAGFTRSDIYLSVFGLLFLITSFCMLRDDKSVRPLFLVAVVSFLLALGKYNPLYAAVLKMTGFYTFRNPSKFLFFTAMASSVLVGKGFSEFFKDTGSRYRERAMKIYSAVLLSCAGVFLASKAVFAGFRERILEAGRWYVERTVYGKPHHRYDLDTYMRKVEAIYNQVTEGASFGNFFNIAAWVLVAAALCWVLLSLKKGKGRMPAYTGKAVFAVIIADLFIFSFIGTGFRGNIAGFDTLDPGHKKIFDRIKSDGGLFRVLPYNIASGKLPRWIMPNANMTYGIDSIAAYSPLVNDRYRGAVRSLEVVDDSLGLVSPENGALDEKLQLIRELNVKYVVAAEELDKPFLELVLDDGEAKLYRLKGFLPRSFVLKGLEPGLADEEVKVETVDYGPGSAFFKVDMPYDGFLAFSENNYPGWEVYIDGKEGKILPFSLIQAVELSKGEHRVRFFYNPYGVKRF